MFFGNFAISNPATTFELPTSAGEYDHDGTHLTLALNYYQQFPILVSGADATEAWWRFRMVKGDTGNCADFASLQAATDYDEFIISID